MNYAMTRMQMFRCVFIISVVSYLVSCVDEPIFEKRTESKFTEEACPSIMVKSSAATAVYDTLPNPYSLDVMQAVYDYYSETPVTLEPTDLYVKFMPKDSLELDILINDYGLELFEYPLDIDLGEGEVYVNPDLPETDLIWLYTTVKPDFSFPTDIAYEILESCYIPEDDETVGVATKGGEVNVEDAAFALMGYEESPQVETKALATPQGTIKVYDNDNGLYVPVKGVKVRCHRLVKWASAYTDENGSYTMSKSFRYKPHYAIVFGNVMDFDIWGNWGPIARANYNMGWHGNSGYSVNIGYNNYAWQWAVVNNSAYEYYKMCEQTGIQKPPAALKIWVWNDVSGSSAPMLRRITDDIGYNGTVSISNFFTNMFYDLAASSLNKALRVVLPDVTIGTIFSNGTRFGYERIYRTVNHELAHASHFSKVGSSYWAKYVSYIMTYGAYGGDDSGNNAQLCAIGEMWGHSMGYIQAAEKFGASSKPMGTLEIVDTWIYPHIFRDIISTNLLSKKQIYDCLTSDVDTYNALVSKLYTQYPNKAVDIEQILNNYPEVDHNVSLPGIGDITYDAFCTDRTITSQTTIGGENILVQNSTVCNGATLSLTAGTSITINSPFTVERGSTLIITGSN